MSHGTLDGTRITENVTTQTKLNTVKVFLSMQNTVNNYFWQPITCLKLHH